MGKNYDNWERLVTAVVRRERDKQIALTHSRDTSTISSASSSFNLRQTSQIPMDYSDLTLDHIAWKAMLPPDKHEVVWKSASLVAELTESLEVAELTESLEVYIQGRIKTQTLSPETLYEAHLVFGFTDKCENVHSANSTIAISCVEPNYYLKVQDFTVRFQQGKDRADGWMETKLGDFYVDDLGRNGEVTVQLQDTSGSMQRGLIIEGIEFRPLKGKKKQKGQRIFSNFRIS